jgi:hypothetical protein
MEEQLFEYLQEVQNSNPARVKAQEKCDTQFVFILNTLNI